MQKINIDIYLGDTADIAINNKLPAGITSYSPYIRWTLPEGIQQARVGVRITNVNNPQLSAIYKSVTVAKEFQIPIGNGLNNKWTGACFIEIQISPYVNYTDEQFLYTSGSRTQNPNGYFVIDTVIENLTFGQDISYIWQKSIDQNIQQSLIYHLQVSNNPIFTDQSLIINDTAINGVLTGLINYNSYSLPIGNYFFRVRAFDGYDYSEWSLINCFKVIAYNPPILTNLAYEITYNDTGDVIITFDTYNEADDTTSVILYYSYADDLSVQYPCILLQTSHIVPNSIGSEPYKKNQLIWQTAKNATGSNSSLKMLGMQKTNITEDVDLYLYAYPYYQGTQGQVSYLPIHLDNSIYNKTITSTSNVKQEYRFRTYITKLPTYSWYDYYGYPSDLYFYISSNTILLDKKYTSNYQYYINIVSRGYYNKTTFNYSRFAIKSSLHGTYKYIKYVGWNSQLCNYILDNIKLLLTKNINIDNATFKQQLENGVFDGNYYYNILNRYDQQVNKYTKQNGTQYRFISGNKGNYSLYVDGRTFRCDDKSQYTIKKNSNDVQAADAWVWSNGNDSSGDEGVIVIPSYQKDVMFNPKYPKQAALKSTGGRTRQNKQFRTIANVNWHECTSDMDWDFYVSGEHETKYYKVWGGQLSSAKGKDQNLEKLANATVTFPDFYRNNIYGQMTFPDGELKFEDNQDESPQFTMYPNYYTKNGYPIGIPQKYWQFVKTKDLYIRRYKIQKSGSQPTEYGYKDFRTVKSNGEYHCYFTDKTVPQVLRKDKKSNLIDNFNVKCYYYDSQNQYYIKTDKRYKDLPNQLFEQYDDLIYYEKHKITNENQKLQLYFHTYVRKYLNQRGKSPQFKYDSQNDKYTIDENQFANVAVPQYIESINGVYSANDFNGKQPAFNLTLKLKRDGQRYILGHHYDWGKRQTDSTILEQLNKFVKDYYPDFENNVEYGNVVLGFKYKHANDLNEIKETRYIYVPVRTYNGVLSGNTADSDIINRDNYEIKYAWFIDKTFDTFSTNENSKISNYWNTLKNDDYIYVHRDTIQPSFYLGTDMFYKTSSHTIKCQGTKFYYHTITDQAYYSDKSKYGVQSYYYVGDLSEEVIQKYTNDSINEFKSIKRVIFLDHKMVNKNSIVITYINNFNEVTKITNYTFYQGSSSYNAYVELQQDYPYIDKILTIKYTYYIYDEYIEKNKIYNTVIFNDYDDYVIFPNDKILEDTFVLYRRIESQPPYQNYEIVPSEYYQLTKDQENKQTILKLLFYYQNKTLDVIYHFKQKLQLSQEQYNIDQISGVSVLQLQGNNYIINNINSEIIEQFIELNCLNKNNRDHQIINYSNNYGIFTVDANNSSYAKQMLKPIKIKYSYDVVKVDRFNIQFDNFSYSLMYYYANINNLRVFYTLQNGIQIDITDRFICKSNGNIVTNGTHRNVKIIVNTTDIQELNEIFSNSLQVSYDGETQNVYLQLDGIIDNRFRQSSGYGHRLYFTNSANSIQEIPSAFYSITGNTINLITGDNYTNILDYVNVPITVVYNANITYQNIYSSLEESVIFVNENYVDDEENIGQIIIGDTYQLPNEDIVDFNCYVINRYFTFDLIDESAYFLDRETGEFILTDNQYFNKMIVFIYTYKQLIYDSVDYQVTLININQQFKLAQNITEDTLKVLYLNSTSNHTFTSENLEYTVSNDIAQVILQYKDSSQNDIILTQGQYQFDLQNHKIILTDTRLINVSISILKYTQLNDQQYTYFDDKLKIQDNQYLNKTLRIKYTYLRATNILPYNNNVLCEYSSVIQLKQDIIRQKQSFLKTDGNEYDNSDIGYQQIKEWKIYYCDDYYKITNYSYDASHNRIIINNGRNYVDESIWLKYSIYHDNGITNSQQITFETSAQKKKLDKNFVYDIHVFYNNVEMTENEQYQLISGYNSYIRLLDKYFNTQLKAEYNEYYIHDQTITKNIQSNQFIFTDKPIDVDSVNIKYTKNGRVVPLTKSNYQVRQIEGQYFIYFDPNNEQYQYCIGQDIIINYSYYTPYFNESNINLQNLKFEEFRMSLQLEHGNVDQMMINYQQQDGTYTLLPSECYSYTTNATNTIVALKSDYVKTYTDKNLIISYTTRLESELYTQEFQNDRSLVFSDKNSYVVLSHTCIEPQTFKMYYETNIGLVLIPVQDYYLDPGSQSFYGVVVLNRKSDNINKYLNKRLYITYKYLKNPRKVYNPQNEKFPYLDHIYRSNIHQGTTIYRSGYSQTQHVGFRNRIQPVYQGDQGVRWITNLTEYSDYTSFQFLYLQSFWDAYNTIHIDGMMDNTTRIILQYAVFGSHEQDDDAWKDFIGVGSTFDEELNHYIMPKMTYDMFVDTFDQSIFENNVTYRLRMGVRGGSGSNTGSSQWVYSIPFTIDHDAVNPVNIIGISYNNWTKRLSITFRIDDTQGDLYDITGMAYSSDGRTWNTIDLSDITGNLWFLQSNKRYQKNLITHTIVWKAGNYNLVASSSYRIRIIANYTKYNQGSQPVFQWKTSMNPLIQYYENKLKSLQGGRQYYRYVYETLRQVENEDGSKTYQQLQTPLQYWQKIQPYQRTITVQSLDQNGNVILDENDEPVMETITQTVDYYVTRGQIAQLQDKLEEVRSKPYKTVFKDGITQSIPWGYRQYYDEDLTHVIDSDGYDKWLRQYDPDYNEQRKSLIATLNSQIESKRLQVAEYRKKVLLLQMKVRRQLIRQGYYSNGFFNNAYDQSDPTPFLFRISIKPLTSTQEEYFKQLNKTTNDQDALPILEMKYQYQLDFYDTFDSQYNHKPLRQEYSYTQNSVTYEIIAGINEDSNSSLYQGYFYLQNDKQPGQIATDELLKSLDSYTYKYSWRIRPFTEFPSNKRQIPFVQVINVVYTSSTIEITFNVNGQDDLGSLSFYNIYNYYTGTTYYIYYQLKNTQIYLLNPRRPMNTSNYNPSNYSSKVNFITDRLRDENGKVINCELYFKNWISFSNRRQRPSVYLFQGQYYLFYDKQNVDNQNTMYLSISKDGNDFGEYLQIYPQYPNEKLQSNGYKSFKNGFVTRQNDKFYLFACGQEDLIYSTSKNIYYFESNFDGEKWGTPIKCNGLYNCNYPSLFKSKLLRTTQQSEITISIDIMLCQQNDQFVFYYSEDKIDWYPISYLSQNETILQDIEFSNINKRILHLQDIEYIIQENQSESSQSSSSYDDITYLSPYLIKQKDTNIFYLYFCIYNQSNGTTDIYRSCYDNGWLTAQKIIQNAFNPCVIQDTYYGQKYHRIYFNKKQNIGMYNNKSNYIDYTIHNYYISNLKSDKFNTALIKRFTSSQIQSYSVNNVTAGNYQKCTHCNGTGILNENTCTYCNGQGAINNIQYVITLDRSGFDHNIDDYNFFIRLDKNRSTKIYRKFGDWLDRQSAQEMNQFFTPKQYSFFDI